MKRETEKLIDQYRRVRAEFDHVVQRDDVRIPAVMRAASQVTEAYYDAAKAVLAEALGEAGHVLRKLDSVDAAMVAWETVVVRIAKPAPADGEGTCGNPECRICSPESARPRKLSDLVDVKVSLSPPDAADLSRIKGAVLDALGGAIGVRRDDLTMPPWCIDPVNRSAEELDMERRAVPQEYRQYVKNVRGMAVACEPTDPHVWGYIDKRAPSDPGIAWNRELTGREGLRTATFFQIETRAMQLTPGLRPWSPALAGSDGNLVVYDRSTDTFRMMTCDDWRLYRAPSMLVAGWLPRA